MPRKKEMLKIKFMSDLHGEFDSPSPTEYIDGNYDIFIIAGDCNTGRFDKTLITIKELAIAIAPKKLLYVTGNHDYYHNDRGYIDDGFDKLTKELDNFIFLNHAVVEVGKYTIIGCTGWQNHENFNSTNYPLNDFRIIADHPRSVKFWGEDDKQFLEDAFEEIKTKNPKSKIVVVTHVPPCIEAIDPSSKEARNKKGYLAAYYNTYSDLIKKYKPTLWLCGHMHDSIDKMLDNKTRIVRNAYGYYGSYRKNSKFNKDLILEV